MPLAPKAREFIAAGKAADSPKIHELPPDEARDMFNGLTALFPPSVEVGTVDDRFLADRIPVRIYRPKSDAETLPAVLYFHGGGWVLGNVETHDTLCRHLCRESGCVVVSVDYRLAPEHPFPAALNDCFNALLYIADHADRLGIDPNRIAVAGDSAGGNLAAAVCLRARTSIAPNIAYQMLIYPVIDSRCDTESYRQFAENHGLSRAEMQYFWKSYLQDQDGTDPLASPIQAKDLSGLPPAHVLTAEFDVLRDEGEAYAQRLKDSGVAVTVVREEGMIHGYVHFSGFFERGLERLKSLGKHLSQTLSAETGSR